MTEGQLQVVRRVPMPGLSDLFATLGQRVRQADSLADAWTVVAEAAVALVPRSAAAGISERRGPRLVTATATTPAVRLLDPILDSMWPPGSLEAWSTDVVQQAVPSPDFASPRRDRRRPGRLAVRSIGSVCMFLTTSDRCATLNWYSGHDRALDDDDTDTAQMLALFAAEATGALAAREKLQNLNRALETNREIGMAIGILMSRHLIRPDGAFDLLRRASQHTHRKLKDIAEEVIAEGQLSAETGMKQPATTTDS